MTTPTRSLKVVAVVAIVATGLIHLWTARDAFGEATCKGLLFVANGIGALVAAVGVYRDRADWGWLLGALVAGGAFLGYVLSRTVGLPGLPAMEGAIGGDRWSNGPIGQRESSSILFSTRLTIGWRSVSASFQRLTNAR
jgi:hypothetical protein